MWPKNIYGRHLYAHIHRFTFDLAQGLPLKNQRRTVILMILTIAAGGTIVLENPMNSLIALHDRYVWMVKLLRSFGIPATS